MTTKHLLVALATIALLATACGDSTSTTTTSAGVVDATTTTAEMVDETSTTAVAETTTTAVEGGVPDDWPEKIVVGFIPSERQETLEDNIQPFMDALAERLGIEVEGIVTSDYNGLVVALGSGQVDFGAFGPFGYVQAKQQYDDIEPLIQSIRFGSATYHGQWFTQAELADEVCNVEPPRVGALENENGDVVLKDPADVVALQVGWEPGNTEPELLEDGTAVAPGMACIGSLEQIRGKRVGFGSPTSTSASVFPRLQLLEGGFDLEADIDFEFLGSHTDTVASVYQDDFEVGVSFDDARRSLREESPDVGTEVVVFNITPEIPNDVVAVRGELPDSLKQAFFDAVADYLTTEEGQEVLDTVYGWTDIRPAVEADFDIVRRAAEQLGVTED